MPGFFSRERIVAREGYPRWLVAPSALAIHLCIGQAYAFSVFNLPLTKVLGITKSIDGDWKLTQLGWIFTVAIGLLGISAAVFGKWLERAGPRASGSLSALCFSAGFFVAALGVSTHQLWLLIAGYGVLGGIGLGLGYITPVSTLVKWFPDRRGMATGIAIMGFGGGAIIAAPLSTWLMKQFATAESVGVAQTFVTLGVLYLLVMLAGAMTFRVPPPDYLPKGWAPPASHQPQEGLEPAQAMSTPQFWLLWGVLCLNVTAGIGLLGQASAMIQEVFKGRVDATDAGRFVSLLSVFNMAGRFGWASLSDRIGRRTTYMVFFALGCVLYFSVPWLADGKMLVGFIACCCAMLTMYGGGFATIPAYLADLFGTRYVGAIHGRLLTAWSVAGALGPILVNYLRQSAIEGGVEPARAYNFTLRLMAGLLVVGFVCNWFVRPLKATAR
ncbi:MAG: OFA family MFS transporter [Myxococcaceae bacterium]